MCCARLASVLALCSSTTVAVELGEFRRKATLAVARHGNKAWMGKIDFLKPDNFYFSPEKAALLKTITWIDKIGDKNTEEGEAIAETFQVLNERDGRSKLTETGKKCEKQVGSFYKANFGVEKLSAGPDYAPAETAYVYSDDDQRDIKSGEMFLQGMEIKGAKVDDKLRTLLPDSIIHDKKEFKGCPGATPNEIMKAPTESIWEACPVSGLSADKIKTFGKDNFATELSYISEVTGTLEPYEDREETWMKGDDEPLDPWATLSGGLRPACMLVQVWEAEVASNADVEKTMYHKLGVDVSKIPDLMRICSGLWSIHMNSVNRARNVELYIHLLASMQQSVSGVESSLAAVRHKPTDHIVMYEGHNYNLDLLRQVLGVHYAIEGHNYNLDKLCDDRNTCVKDGQPYHARLNIEIFSRMMSGTEKYFVQLSFFQLSIFQQKSCTGDHVPEDPFLTKDRNLISLDMPETLCPHFDREHKMCPWEDFQDLLRRFIHSTQKEDLGFCTEESTTAWMLEQPKPVQQTGSTWPLYAIAMFMAAFSGAYGYYYCYYDPSLSKPKPDDPRELELTSGFCGSGQM